MVIAFHHPGDLKMNYHKLGELAIQYLQDRCDKVERNLDFYLQQVTPEDREALIRILEISELLYISR